MRLTELQDYFSNPGLTGVSRLKELISEEVREHQNLMKKKGASAPVYVIEDCHLSATGTELSILCRAFLNRELNQEEIAYIVDAMLLSEHVIFESEQLEDLFFSLTDPVANGELTDDVVRSMLIHLQQRER
jgi:hypothetical protein